MRWLVGVCLASAQQYESLRTTTLKLLRRIFLLAPGLSKETKTIRTRTPTRPNEVHFGFEG